MDFGEIPVGEAAGAILVHSVRLAGRALRKGRVLTEEDVAALTAGGIERVTAARIAADELGEDEAATLLARAAAGQNITIANAFTGRANLFATERGLCVFDRDRLDAMNLVDEAVTLATLPPYAIVEPKQMVATVKIVPFATPRDIVERCAALGEKILRVAPFLPLQVGLIQTRLPGMKETILDKTVGVTAARLESLGSSLQGETRCAHEVTALAAELTALLARKPDMILIAGASAIVDRRDVIPAALVACGGEIEHFGMPVDPGNLILLGRISGITVLGLPGCARSPKENGFDWVLQRLAAGIAVTGKDVMRMGAGGLLAEIPSRGLPRAAAVPAEAKPSVPREARIGALILAAGQSRRMGEINKLMIELDGKPMVRHVAETVLASRATPIVAVLGHERDRVRGAFSGLKIRAVYNPDYAEGISTSLRRGLAALPEDIDGVVVCLGDMPLLGAAEIGRLIDAFNPVEGRAIIVPTRRGKRGNPVLWGKRFFAEMQEVAGDVGARHLIGAYPEAVVEVEMTGEGTLLDIDTPEALADFLDRAPADFVSEALYQQAIIDLDRAAHAAGRLSDPTVSVTAHNPLCGDRVTLDLVLDGQIVGEIGHRVRGCALCEAAASAIGMHARGAHPTELLRAAADIAALIAGNDDEPVWPELLAFRPVRDFKSRHRCVLLPFEALTDALAKAGAH